MTQGSIVTGDKPQSNGKTIDLTQVEPKAPVDSLPIPKTAPYDPAKTREWTRVFLSGTLVFILAIVVIAPLIMLWGKWATITDLKELLTILVSPVVALVGAAVGFYFGEKSKGG